MNKTKQESSVKSKYKSDAGSYKRPELTYEDLQPVLSKYGDKIKTYKKTHQLVGKGIFSFVSVAFRGLFSQYKIVRQIGCYFLFVLIYALAFAFEAFPNVIFGVIAFSIFLTLVGRILVKRSITSFKIQLIQALFMDHNIAVTVDPKKHVDKEHFNSTNIFQPATLLAGEDCIKGSTAEFHFILSELRAKGKLSWTGFKDVYTGLYFYGTWQKPSVVPNFRIQQRSFLDGLRNSSELRFQKHFTLVDDEGHQIHNPELLASIPKALQEGFVMLIDKYNYPMEVICHDNQIVVLLEGSRDYFPLNFDDDVDDKSTFQRISKDVFFTKDLVQVLDSI